MEEEVEEEGRERGGKRAVVYKLGLLKPKTLFRTAVSAFFKHVRWSVNRAAIATDGALHAQSPYFKGSYPGKDPNK